MANLSDQTDRERSFGDILTDLFNPYCQEEAAVRAAQRILDDAEAALEAAQEATLARAYRVGDRVHALYRGRWAVCGIAEAFPSLYGLHRYEVRFVRKDGTLGPARACSNVRPLP